MKVRASHITARRFVPFEFVKMCEVLMHISRRPSRVKIPRRNDVVNVQRADLDLTDLIRAIKACFVSAIVLKI